MCNYIYNPRFLSPPNSLRRWASGWERIGGDSETKWMRINEHAKENGRCINIENISYPGFSGIKEIPPVFFPVLAGEIWQVEVSMKSTPAALARIAVNIFDQDGKQLDLIQQDYETQEQMAVYTLTYNIPADATQAIAEAGVTGCHKLWISEIRKIKKEPSSMDEQMLLQESKPFPRMNTVRTEISKHNPQHDLNQYFLASFDQDTTQPKVQFGRKLAALHSGSQEHIIFTPGEREVIFYELYISCSGSITLEVIFKDTAMKQSLPKTELYLHFAAPWRVLPGDSPLVIKICNQAGFTISYTVSVTGILFPV